jgi:Holliday junction resolvasome RuvABC DNA-binding subunit
MGKPQEVLPTRKGLKVEGVIVEVHPSFLIVDIDGELYQVAISNPTSFRKDQKIIIFLTPIL